MNFDFLGALGGFKKYLELDEHHMERSEKNNNTFIKDINELRKYYLGRENQFRIILTVYLNEHFKDDKRINQPADVFLKESKECFEFLCQKSHTLAEQREKMNLLYTIWLNIFQDLRSRQLKLEDAIYMICDTRPNRYSVGSY